MNDPIWNVSALTTAIIVGAAAVVAASFGGFKSIVQTWFEIAEMRLRKRYAAGIKSIAVMYKVIESAKRMPHVHRILMLAGKNCGGIPHPAKPYVISCYFGWSQKPDTDPAAYYNFDIKADMHYVSMLQQMIKEGVTTQVTASMPDQSMLKSYYSAEGVVDSRIYYLFIDANTNELHFCSVASYEKAFTPSEVHSINLIVDRLRSLMTRSGSYVA